MYLERVCIIDNLFSIFFRNGKRTLPPLLSIVPISWGGGGKHLYFNYLPYFIILSPRFERRRFIPQMTTLLAKTTSSGKEAYFRRDVCGERCISPNLYLCIRIQNRTDEQHTRLFFLRKTAVFFVSVCYELRMAFRFSCKFYITTISLLIFKTTHLWKKYRS
jgi:hypothetical protein